MYGFISLTYYFKGAGEIQDDLPYSVFDCTAVAETQWFIIIRHWPIAAGRIQFALLGQCEHGHATRIF